ncbi:MAG: RNA 3'-terminal phosphate cyclase [Candidatus Anstonellaceae archaeon]
MIEIDGSIGEGGGQVLRTALSVACVLQEKVRIYNIRAGREKPGLRAQHLTVCKLLGELTGAKMTGAALGSSEIIFEPEEISGGKFSFDIGTAGSCTLLLQAALPVMLHATGDCRLEITGGTHVRGAPTFEYFANVFLPATAMFGAKLEAKLERCGFYPQGGGKIAVKTTPSAFSGCEIVAHEHTEANYEIITSSLPPHVAEREEKKLRNALHDAGIRAAGKKEAVAASCAGNALAIWSSYLGVSVVGEAGKPAEKVAGDAAGAFVSEVKSGASVDSHLADQLLVYAALAKGKTQYTAREFTQHLTTNAEVLRRMTERNIMLLGEGRVEVL